jgi:hypothetical protein
MIKRLLILIFPLLLFSSDYDPQLLSDYGGDPSSLIEGCVNAITGDFIVRQDDLVVKGFEPIQIPLHYSPRDIRDVESTYGGWDFAEKFLVVLRDYNGLLSIYERSGN